MLPAVEGLQKIFEKLSAPRCVYICYSMKEAMEAFYADPCSSQSDLHAVSYHELQSFATLVEFFIEYLLYLNYDQSTALAGGSIPSQDG